MRGKLQQTYRVSRELGRNAYYRGSIPLSQMPRLASQLLRDDALIEVTFEFEKNACQQSIIKGHINAKLHAECQRCLQELSHVVDRDFELLIDAPEEDLQFSRIDSIYSSEDYLDVFVVIEDELILGLPIIMKHEDTSCNRYLLTEPTDIRVAETNNAFSVLNSLKGNR